MPASESASEKGDVPAAVRGTHRSRFLIGVLVVAIILALVQVAIADQRMADWFGYTPSRPGSSDFGSYYLYARMGLDHGWNTLYDLTVERQEWQALGGLSVIIAYPMIYPPPLAWLVAPFALLPLPLAFALWETMVLGLFLLIWKLLVRGVPLVRWIHLAGALTLFPVVFGLLLAQVLIPVLAVVAIAWRLLSRRHEVLAGLVLLVILVKPQVAFLVPLTLLASGRWRAFATWSIGAASISSLALVSLGPDGTRFYIARLSQAAATAPEFMVSTNLTLQGVLGSGPIAILARLLLVALVLVIAYRHRGTVPDIPIAAGLVGSLLVTPYIHIQDVTALVVAAWIYLQTPLSRWQRSALLAGYALLLAMSFETNNALGDALQTTLVLFEVVWLLSLFARRGQELPAWWPRRSESRLAA